MVESRYSDKEEPQAAAVGLDEKEILVVCVTW